MNVWPVNIVIMMKIIFLSGMKAIKAQKASIKEELMPIAWHPSRYWDWCMSEDEKKETEKTFLCLMARCKKIWQVHKIK